MSDMDAINPAILLDADGTVTRYAWPGGYPVFYVTADSGELCAACVTARLSECRDPTERQYYVVGHDANWEDPFMYCDDCGERIESAYAEDSVYADRSSSFDG